MPLKKNELNQILINYLEKHDAENVMDFRKKRRKIIVETAIPETENRLLQIEIDLKASKGKEKYDLESKLQKTKKYLNWLRNQIVFIDERSAAYLSKWGKESS